MRNGKILIVDDNDAVLKTLKLLLSKEFTTVITASVPSLIPSLLIREDVDVVLLDMNFVTGKRTGDEGLFWLERIQDKTHVPAVIFITAFGDVELAVSSLKKGAADFITKPWDNNKLIRTVVSAWEKRQKELSFIHTEKDHSIEDKEQITEMLLAYFLQKYGTLYGKPYLSLTPEAWRKTEEILWKGNVEHLEKIIERAVVLTNKTTLTENDIYEEIPFSLPNITLEEMEKQFIKEVLKEHKGNLTAVAKQLNISRQTLYNKMNKYGI